MTPDIPDVIQLTKDFVSIYSVNPFLTDTHEGSTFGYGNEANLNAFIAEMLKRAGFKVMKQVVEAEQNLNIAGKSVHIPARHNILAEKGEGKNSILFFGHSDTVDIKEGWQTEPLVLTEKIVDGRTRMYGLGANDMKSGLAAIIAGLANFEPKDFKIKVAIVVDEEYWSFGAVKLVESSFIHDVTLAIAPEIGDGSDDPNSQAIGLGRLGRTEFDFLVVGKACHGADVFIKEDAINACHESAKLQSKIIEYCSSAKATFSHNEISVTNSAYISKHAGGYGTLSVPDCATFILDRSLLPTESASSELLKLKRVVELAKENGVLNKDTEVQIRERSRPTPPCRPYFSPPERPIISEAINIIKTVNPNINYYIGRSVADENRLAEKGIATLTIGPLGAGSHTNKEWVDKESVIKLVDAYEALIRNMNGTILATKA